MATTSDYSGWGFKQRSTGHHISNTAPIDDRCISITLNEAKEKTVDRRYPGLRVYVMGEEKEYWFKSGVSNNDLVVYRPWASDTEFRQTIEQNIINNVGGSSGVGGVSLTPYKITASEVADKNNIPTHLTTLIDTSTQEKREQWKGAEINVVYTDSNGGESFMKYVYLDGGWRMSCGSQTIEFSIYSYTEGNWAGWTPPSTQEGDGFLYSKNETPGYVTLCVRHNFATQYVDATLYLTGSENIDGDNNLDAFGEEVVVAKKCTQLSDPNYPGYWVCLELFIPSVPQGATQKQETYTLLLQR